VVRVADPGAVMPGPSWEVSMNPPSYANRPSLYRNDVINQRLRVPEDSMIMVCLYGDDSKYIVDETVSGRVENLSSVGD
jgi:hypothetical protein